MNRKYYYNKTFKANIYTHECTHWTIDTGEALPPQIDNIQVGATNHPSDITAENKKVCSFIDAHVLNSMYTSLFSILDNPTGDYLKYLSATVGFPKPVLGFKPVAGDLQGANNGSKLVDPFNYTNPALPGGTNDKTTKARDWAQNPSPFQFNTSFLLNLSNPATNIAQSRKGTKVTLSSLYIRGSISKPPMLTNYITNNQVTYYIIWQSCKEVNAGPPNWYEIFDLVPSTKLSPTSYADTNILVNTTITTLVNSNRIGTNRFTNPSLFINVNNKEKYVILKTFTLDLDSENTQFDINLYEKLKVQDPRSNSKVKSQCTVVYSNTSSNNTIQYVENGAIFLVRVSYGTYIQGTNDLLNGVGTTLPVSPPYDVEGNIVNDNSYNSLCKVYPMESWKCKVFYKDV